MKTETSEEMKERWNREFQERQFAADGGMEGLPGMGCFMAVVVGVVVSLGFWVVVGIWVVGKMEGK